MRCYNGCPDKELQAMIDERAAVIKEGLSHGIQLTYFPGEEKWKAFKGYHSASKFHSTPRGALDEAMA